MFFIMNCKLQFEVFEIGFNLRITIWNNQFYQTKLEQRGTKIDLFMHLYQIITWTHHCPFERLVKWAIYDNYVFTFYSTFF